MDLCPQKGHARVERWKFCERLLDAPRFEACQLHEALPETVQGIVIGCRVERVQVHEQWKGTEQTPHEQIHFVGGSPIAKHQEEMMEAVLLH